MISDGDLKPIHPRGLVGLPSAAHVVAGLPMPKPMRIKTFSPEEWECFIEEWSTSLNDVYVKVRRFAGSGDLGVDIAGFYTTQGFEGAWDSFQCKRYGHPLRPSDAWVEIGKIIYYSFLKKYIPPQSHYFVCTQDIGTGLEKLLNNSAELKMESKKNWDNHCKNKITSTTEVALSGDLLDYFDRFDFSIFTSKSHLELISGHSETRFHSVRFGGGLPTRPEAEIPPDSPAKNESQYIRHLLNAYADYLGLEIQNPDSLKGHGNLNKDFLRQRERFYQAESLRNFARDTVDPGTFESLKNEIYFGVIDIVESDHQTGFDRLKATILQSTQVAATSNPLISVLRVQDRQGICHHLVNDDRFVWVSTDD